eukprot:scaffold45436_cov49-Attheya_sp.AAC.4
MTAADTSTPTAGTTATRCSAEDFNYTFACDTTTEGGEQKEEETPLVKGKEQKDEKEVTAGSKVMSRAESSQKPYVYSKAPSSRFGGATHVGDVGVAAEDGGGGSPASMLASVGACCCCVTALLILAGGIVLCVERFGDDPAELVGSILLVLAAAGCLVGCCACGFGCLAVAAGAAGSDVGHGDSQDPDEIKLTLKRWNDRYEKFQPGLESVRLNVLGSSSNGMKAIKEAEKKELAEQKKEETSKRQALEKRVELDLEAGLSVKNIRHNYRPVAFLILFDGDTMLEHAMELLRKQVSIVVNTGRPGVDQAVIVLTSPGGSVSAYGLASSQLIRIRQAGIELVVCVDTVAASGGYMMASVADTICAAPFAIVGSIGVVTQIPNVQRFLNKNDIDAYLVTSGKYKRTIDIIGDVTEEGKEKLQEELDAMHHAFQDHIGLARPQLKEVMDSVATGEYWLAVHAKEKGLVDQIMTSDEYLESLHYDKQCDIIQILEKKKRSILSASLFPSSSLLNFKSTITEGLSAFATKQQQQKPRPMAIH